jgi:hypothetical protein
MGDIQLELKSYKPYPESPLLALDGVFKKPFSSKVGGVGEEEYNTYQTTHTQKNMFLSIFTHRNFLISYVFCGKFNRAAPIEMKSKKKFYIILLDNKIENTFS